MLILTMTMIKRWCLSPQRRQSQHHGQDQSSPSWLPLLRPDHIGTFLGFPWFSSIVTMMLLIFATEAGPHWNSSFYGPIHSGASQHNTDNDKNGDCDNIYKKWILLLDFSCGVASIAWRADFQTNYEQWENLPSSITSRQVRSRHKHIIPHLSTN